MRRVHRRADVCTIRMGGGLDEFSSLLVYTQLDRASSVQEIDFSVNCLPSLPASHQHISREGSPWNSSVPCTEEHEYLSWASMFFYLRFLHAIPFIRT